MMYVHGSKSVPKGYKINVHPIGWPQNKKMGVMCSWALGHVSESIMIFRVAQAPTSIIMA
jgi:hypothetical protein